MFVSPLIVNAFTISPGSQSISFFLYIVMYFCSNFLCEMQVFFYAIISGFPLTHFQNLHGLDIYVRYLPDQEPFFIPLTTKSAHLLIILEI